MEHFSGGTPDIFAEKYGAKYEKAVTCLTKDREALLTFYDFPADHWKHLRTGNPIGSVFATVRHSTVRTKGALSQMTVKLMVFKLVQAAAKTWRRLKGANQLPLVIEAVTFTEGCARGHNRRQPFFPTCYGVWFKNRPTISSRPPPWPTSRKCGGEHADCSVNASVGKEQEFV